MTDAAQDKLVDQARAAYRSGAFVQSRDTLAEVLAKDPTHLDALSELVNACNQIGDTATPVRFLERARGAAPESQDILVRFIEALIGNQEQQKAFDLAREALEHDPDNIALRLQVARGWMGIGETENARADLWLAHELDPSAIDPLYFLARLGDKKDLERLTTLIDAAWENRSVGAAEVSSQLMLAFTRATLAEKMGKYDIAWDAYVAGNELHRGLAPFDEDGYIGALNEQLQLFGKVEPVPPSEGGPGANIVFIVSLPRSGSTLTEQILASHSRVRTIGERALVFEALQIWKQGRNPAALADARRHYLDGASAILNEADVTETVILDKSITNYIYLGFLRQLFPGAKFVHVVRAPMDAGFSCYATAFGLNALKWCSDLGTIGRVFRRYQKLMKTWMRQDRGDLMTLSYEDLTEDPEPKVRELLAFCGLEWEPACLAFHENKRQVSTASVAQVRRPIYKSAQGRAAPFEAQLSGLTRALGRAADPYWYKQD